MAAAVLQGKILGNWSPALASCDILGATVDRAKILPWEATACRWEWERLSRLCERRPSLIARARRAVQDGLTSICSNPAQLAQIYREQAWLQILDGSPDAAGNSFQQSSDQARRSYQGGAFQLAWTQWDWARWRSSQADPDAPRLLNEANEALRAAGGEWLADENAHESLSLEDLTEATTTVLRGGSAPGKSAPMQSYLSHIRAAVDQRQQQLARAAEASARRQEQSRRNQVFSQMGPVALVWKIDGVVGFNARAKTLLADSLDQAMQAGLSGCKRWKSWHLTRSDGGRGIWVAITEQDPERAQQIQTLYQTQTEDWQGRVKALADLAPHELPPQLAWIRDQIRNRLEKLHQQPCSTIDEVLNQFRQRGLVIDCEAPIWPVRPDIARAFAAVTREGLNNVLKHSGQKRAQVRVARDGRAWSLSICDGGVGNPPGRRGCGLGGIQWLADELGGELSITSGPGFGITLRAPFADVA